MELKNALTVCLISLFSATLVVLIARALDLQAASRLEPQLVRIVEELEAIRKQGGIAIDSSTIEAPNAVDDGLVVYYFHSNVRCVTCKAIESQSHEAVQTAFESELADGRMVWKALNYEEADGMDLGRQFEVQVPVVVLAQMKGGQLGEWKRLDRVWALVGDKEAFAGYVQAEVREMLASMATAVDVREDDADLPVPGEESDTAPVSGEATDDLPIPQEYTILLPTPEDEISDLPIADESSDIPVPN
jgi:hypothetical protein